MPSPTWCTTTETPLMQALVAAQHAAWAAPAAQRDATFTRTLQRLLGPTRAEPALASAIALFRLQPEPPAGVEQPPTGTQFAICPRCQRLTGTKHTIPQRGRLKLAVLRDADWLQQQLERGRTLETIANQLGCDKGNVRDWVRRHGLQTAKAERIELLEARIPVLHAQGRGPGGIARELDAQVTTVRRVLARLGLATRKRGQVYHDPAWWVERLERQGWTARECAREAGVTAHNATYYVTKFGLSHLTAAHTSRKGQRKWKPKYPQLANAAQLRALLDHHGTYEAVARALGCAPTLVSRYARELLGAAKRHENVRPHSARSWWTERLDQGHTTWALAAEAGIAETSAREKLRVLGAELLAQAYRNNTAAERQRRRSA